LQTVLPAEVEEYRAAADFGIPRVGFCLAVQPDAHRLLVTSPPGRVKEE
jgi:hypothetical protein